MDRTTTGAIQEFCGREQDARLRLFMPVTGCRKLVVMPTSSSTIKPSWRSRVANLFRPRVLRDLAIYLALMLPVVWGLVAVEQARFASIAQAGSMRDLRNYAHAFTGKCAPPSASSTCR